MVLSLALSPVGKIGGKSARVLKYKTPFWMGFRPAAFFVVNVSCQGQLNGVRFSRPKRCLTATVLVPTSLHVGGS